MLQVFGIRQCDTCRKARKWLDQQRTPYRWVDLREDPVDTATLANWWRALGPALVNKRSTTWRQLGADHQQLDNDEAVIALLAEHPTLVKRPLVQWPDALTVGFNESDWRERLRS